MTKPLLTFTEIESHTPGRRWFEAVGPTHNDIGRVYIISQSKITELCQLSQGHTMLAKRVSWATAVRRANKHARECAARVAEREPAV
jgi:hypothetical protein